jgi:hypothetical protein
MKSCNKKTPADIRKRISEEHALDKAEKAFLKLQIECQLLFVAIEMCVTTLGVIKALKSITVGTRTIVTTP